MSNDSLAKIINRCQQGDEKAFGWLLREYGPRLYRYFLRTSGSADDAEDLLQDLFVKLLVKIGDYHHEGRFDNWLFCVAANLVRDHFRRRQRSVRTVPMQTNGGIGTVSPAEAVSSGPRPEERLETKEQLDRLQQALGRLEPRESEIILLRHYGGLSFKEIAEHFQVPIGTALARVHRGRKKLNNMLEEKK